MTELLTAARMRAIEGAAIAAGTVTGLELMERAGRGVVEATFAEWPALQATSRRAVVLCGPGNNGGDGFVVARLLKDRGWAVEVFLYGDPAKLPPDARLNHERWCGMGAVRPASSFDQREVRADLMIDAILGTGLSRPPTGALLDFLQEAGASREGEAVRRLVAVDLVSGLSADTGRDLVEAGESRLTADLTVTFHAAKLGHMLGDGPALCGKLRVADIGLGLHSSAAGAALARLPEPEQGPGEVGPQLVGQPMCGSLRPALRKLQGHKYAHGHALILSGPPGRTGAARLAARGALRIGAGLVTVGCLPEAVAEHAARLDAIMLRPIADAAALTGVLKDGRINALCLGPGLGVGPEAAALLAVALGAGVAPPPAPPHEGEGRHPATGRGVGEGALPLPFMGRGEGRGAPPALVLDADALTLLAADPGLFAALPSHAVLTPHAGEFARLFPDLAARLTAPVTAGPGYSKVDATRAAARRAGCLVLFKGADTVIATPDGRCRVNAAQYDRAAPWLATAGSGDVLAGFITGLLARGLDPMAAAEAGAWLHVECARRFGPGLIAEDLPEQLPGVFRDLGI